MVPPHLVAGSISRKPCPTPRLSSTMSAVYSVWDRIAGRLRRSSPAGRRTSPIGEMSEVNVALGGVDMTLFGFDFHELNVPSSFEVLAAEWRQ